MISFGCICAYSLPTAFQGLIRRSFRPYCDIFFWDSDFFGISFTLHLLRDYEILVPIVGDCRGFGFKTIGPSVNLYLIVVFLSSRPPNSVAGSYQIFFHLTSEFLFCFRWHASRVRVWDLRRWFLKMTADIACWYSFLRDANDGFCFSKNFLSFHLYFLFKV